jgi:hypothetical protein
MILAGLGCSLIYVSCVNGTTIIAGRTGHERQQQCPEVFSTKVVCKMNAISCSERAAYKEAVRVRSFTAYRRIA